MKREFYILLTSTATLMMGCGNSVSITTAGSGSGSGGGTTQVSPISAVTSVKNTLNQVGALAGHTRSAIFMRNSPQIRSEVGALTTGWGSDWTSTASNKAYFKNFVDGQPDVNAKTFFVNMLDPTYQGFNGTNYYPATVFGKVAFNLQIGCLLGTLMTKDASGLIAVGSQSITFTSGTYSSIQNCGISSSDYTQLNGYTLSATVSATTDTTYYDRKITFAAFNSKFETESVLLRATSTEVNIADSQTHSNGQYLERLIIRYDITNQKIYLEGMSGAGTSAPTEAGSLWFYRLAYDVTSDVAKIFQFVGGLSDSTTNAMKYTIVGKPSSAGSTVAYSAYSSVGSGGGLNSGVRSDCINRDTQAIGSGATLACTETGVAVDDTALEALLTDLRTSNGTTPRALFSGFGTIAESQSLPFSMSTVFTANVNHP